MEIPSEPCNPSPCGANAICKERNGAGSCTCLPEYFGDPYTGCRPECVINTDCARDRACVNNKCRDPCPGTCGINAECRVANHAPSCTCLPGYSGNPISACQIIPTSKLFLQLFYFISTLFYILLFYTHFSLFYSIQYHSQSQLPPLSMELSTKQPFGILEAIIIISSFDA